MFEEIIPFKSFGDDFLEFEILVLKWLLLIKDGLLPKKLVWDLIPFVFSFIIILWESGDNGFFMFNFWFEASSNKFKLSLLLYFVLLNK